MQTTFPSQETLLAAFSPTPKKSSSYLIEILLAAAAALFWTCALPLACLLLLATALGRRLGELTRRIARLAG
jgi:hypothetical protein